MGFMDIFVKPEENKEVSPQQQSVKQQTQVQSQSTSVQQQTPTATQNFTSPLVDDISHMSVSTPVSTISTNDINENIVKDLWNVILNKNLPGPDYLEVVNSAAKLESMGLPEDKRYEAAFKMLTASYPNFTKDDLLSSIDTYIGFIQEELTEGKKQCQEKRAANIGDRQMRIQQLNEHANSILLEIEKLQQEHKNSLEAAKKLEAEVAEATKAIDREEIVFNNSVNVVLERLNSDKKTMSSLNI